MIDPPTIWLYWVTPDSGEPRPAYLEACLESVRRNSGCRVELVTNESARDWVPDLHPAFERLCPAHQADVFRIHVLHRHGGMYLDFDTVVVRSLVPLFNELGRFELVGADWRPDGLPRSAWSPLGISVLGPCRPGLEFLRRAAEAQRAILDRKRWALRLRRRYPIEWEELLADLVTPIYAAHPPRARILDGARSWYALAGFGSWRPGPWSDVFRPLAEIGALPDSELYTLSHSLYTPEQRRLSREQLLAGDTVLAHLLRTALAA